MTAVAQAAETQLLHDRARRETNLVERYIDRLPAAGPRPSALVAVDGRVLAASPCGWLGERVELRDGQDALPDGSNAVFEPLADGARIVWGVRGHERRVPRRVLRIRALGPETPGLRLAGASLAVTPRQAELLIVLAMTPGGLSAQALAGSLYGPRAKAVTVRAEVARVRRVAGELIGAQPYRLAANVRADFLDVERLLSRCRLAAALARYDGPLLPGSRAPAIVARRAALENAIGDAVCDAGDGALRRRWERKRRRVRPCNSVQPLSDPQRLEPALKS